LMLIFSFSASTSKTSKSALGAFSLSPYDRCVRAADLGLDLSKVKGSGLGGRITAQDVVRPARSRGPITPEEARCWIGGAR
jgi:pyruvate/2-oxoglutarate dehydrogenase complex dihydrolipoamide acyltransferase (E2) component